MWVPKLLLSPVRIRIFAQIWPDIGIFGHFGPGLAASFGALLVGWLVVVARELYLARHLFTLLYCVMIFQLLPTQEQLSSFIFQSL